MRAGLNGMIVGVALCGAAAGCVDSTGGAPAAGPDAGLEATLPEGTTGVEHVRVGGQELDWPWVVRDGQKWVDDDFAIGPALVREPLAATSLTIGAWPGNHVPYCVQPYDATTNPLGLSPAQTATVEQALVALEAITPLHFDEFSCATASPPPRYVDYRLWTTTTASVTTAGIGHAGNTIQFAPSFGTRTVWHETGHALGFMHEQKRPDRDQFVNYYPGCLDDPAHDSQFAEVGSTTLTLTPYDIDSVMEYPSSSFSISYPACPTLLYGAPNPATAPIYGTYNGVTLRGTLLTKSPEWSLEDINAAYQLYEPALGNAEASDQLGKRMADGDFDGDGYDDLAVAAIDEGPWSTIRSGAVFVYKGTMNGLVAWKVLGERDFAGAAPQDGDEFGFGLAAGDLDGDGADDLVVGAPLAGSPRGGQVFVYRGGRGGLAPIAGPASQSSTGAGTTASNDEFGYAIRIGHFGGAALGYVAVGAPDEALGGIARGVVNVLQWNGSTLSSYQNLTMSASTTPHDNDWFGYALSAADLDGDGITDLAVGAPQPFNAGGKVIPFFGSSAGLGAGAPIADPATATTGDDFGYALAAGQLDPGGAKELVVGAPGRASAAGRVFVYRTSGSGTATAFLLQQTLQQSLVPGETGHAGDRFGSSVAVGDLDDDGSADVAVGVPSKPESGLAAAGAVDVFRSSAGPSVVLATAPSANDGFGASVSIGNWNHGAQSAITDHHADLAIGLPGRPVNGNSNAGRFDFYRGATLALWRSMSEETHAGP